jgi:hypothetical protein
VITAVVVPGSVRRAHGLPLRGDLFLVSMWRMGDDRCGVWLALEQPGRTWPATGIPVAEVQEWIDDAKVGRVRP